MKNIESLIVSRTSSRIRFRILMLQDPAVAEKVEAAVRDVAGVTGAEVNSRTKSLLIFIDRETFDMKELQTALNQEVPRGLVRPQPRCLLNPSMTAKGMRQVENKSMLIFGTATVLSVLARSYALHMWAGWAFVAAAALHTWRYKKNL
jgi:cation transport ATPase